MVTHLRFEMWMMRSGAADDQLKKSNSGRERRESDDVPSPQIVLLTKQTPSKLLPEAMRAARETKIESRGFGF